MGDVLRDAMIAHRAGRLVDDLVVGRAAILERQVEPVEAQIEAHDLGIQDPNRLLEQFLTGLVALENRDHQRLGHRRLTIPAGRGVNLRTGDAHGALQLVR